jgi:hypothetical protein
MGRFDETTTDGKQAPDRTQTRWQVIATWKDTAGRRWSDPSEPFTDRAEAWAAYHAAVDDRASGWTSHGGREVPGPRVGHQVEIREARLVRNADGKWHPSGHDRTVETTESDPSETMVDIRGRIAALAAAVRGRSEGLAGRCHICPAPATTHDPDGTPFCVGHLPQGQP